MPEYILAYHGGNPPSSPEEGAKHMEQWKAWAAGLNDSLVNPGTPLGKSRTVSSSGVADDGGSNPISGYSVLKADDIDAAVELVKGCPFLDIGGSLEVAEMIDMKM